MEPNFRRRTIPRLRPGDPITAEWLNRIVDALNDAQALHTLAPRGGGAAALPAEGEDAGFPFQITAEFINEKGSDRRRCIIQIKDGDFCWPYGNYGYTIYGKHEIEDARSYVGTRLWVVLIYFKKAKINTFLTDGEGDEGEEEYNVRYGLSYLFPFDLSRYYFEFMDNDEKKERIDLKLGNYPSVDGEEIEVPVIIGYVDFVAEGGQLKANIEQRLSSDLVVGNTYYNAPPTLQG